MPVPVTVTFAVEVAVVVGTYRTLIEQLVPGFITNPDTQVPPGWIEKVPDCVPTGVSVGFAVNVNGPAAAPVAVLATVMVAFSVN